MESFVPDNNKEVLLRLQETSQTIENEITELPEEDANANAVEGEWSVKEVFSHLRDAEQICQQRLRQILEEDEPFLRAFNPDELASEHDYKSLPWSEVRQAFFKLRAENVQLLAELKPVQWLKGAIHQERGHVTIHDLAEGLCTHSEAHLEQIRHVVWLGK